MSIDRRFDPRLEIRRPPEAPRHPARPYIFLLFGILLLFLWAWWTRPAAPPPTGTAGVAQTAGGGLGSGSGSGGSDHGNGPGSGDRGDGPGAGEQGEGRGGGGSDSGSGSSSGSHVAADSNGAALTASANGSSGGGVEHAPEAPPKTRAMPFQAVNPEPAAAAVKAAPGAAEGRRGFYGVEVSGTGRVLFLVDISGSMGGPSQEERSKTKMDILQFELRKAICGGPALTEQSYRRSGSFFIIGFDHQQIQFPDANLCRYRDRKAMAAAMEFIDQKIAPRGGTLMRPAWAKAAVLIREQNIRTVYFLTDGEDNNGLGADELLAFLGKEIPRMVVVHCIAIGHDQEFMRKVADERKGKYVYRP